ncbi:F-box domain-containing protein [Favolaschia claudopus]|uniref:F-box domain-containing protein n=1 Tax=Favolaschia claudopus TaxID=2862362 RepID=A0AAW0AJC7_9AGAR
MDSRWTLSSLAVASRRHIGDLSRRSRIPKSRWRATFFKLNLFPVAEPTDLFVDHILLATKIRFFLPFPLADSLPANPKKSDSIFWKFSDFPCCRPALRSVRRALTVSRFESPQHRRKRREAAETNGAAPIACLPAELLCIIFLFCAACDPVQGDRGLGWLTVTHVAHACPDLWANIIFRRKLVPIMLARSMEVPLVIRVNLDKNTHFKPRYIREHIGRAGVLDIEGSHSVLDTFFVDNVGKTPAPRLRSLSVVNTADYGASPMWLDAKVFHGTEPRQQCGLPWNSPWFSNLTELYLASLHKAHGTSVTMLLSVLVTSPLLESLTLMNTKTYGDTLDRTLSFPLRNLRTLHLSEPLPICSQILTSLRFPSIVTATVSCLTLRNGREPSGYLIDTILCHRDFCQTYHSLRIEEITSEILRSPPPPTPQTRVCASIFTTTDANPLLHQPWLPWRDIARPLGSHASPPLHVNVPLERDSWLNLCKCSNVVHLAISTVNPISILALLMERAMCRIGVGAASVVGSDREADGSCKQFFLNITFKKPPPFPSAIDTLRALLWARLAGRRAIRLVKIKACQNIFQQDLDHLEYLAGSFEWDGQGRSGEAKEDGGYPDLRSYSLNVFEFLNAPAPVY